MSFKTLSESVVGLCNDVMGEEITYTPNGDTPVTIKGVFDNAWVEIDGVQSLKPTLRIDLSDLSSAPGKGDQVTIETVEYKIIESRVDGFGGSTLILHKV
jgi:hypothetical protein